MRGSVEIAVEFRPRHGRRTTDLMDRVAEIALLQEQPAGRRRATFVLDPDGRGFGTLASLLKQVGARRSTTVWVDGEPEATAVVQEMAECARPFALTTGRCGFVYSFSVPDRCRACPLYDAARAEASIEASYAGNEQVG